MRRYYIKTYGCQMNVADSDKLAAMLDSGGYQPATNEKEADLILVNTCAVRQNAEDRAAWFITSMKNLKLQNPNLKIGVCGCFVTEPGRKIEEDFPHVDFFIPPNSPDKLTEFIRPSPSGRGGPVECQRVRAKGEFVSIMTGCDNFCSYCVVPFVRGREKSRPMEEVLAEVKSLIDQGVTDITLLGQNVNSYKYSLANLLKAIHSLDIGHLTLVIKFLTSHPRDMTDEIIETATRLPFVAKEFQIPLQSGDDIILQKMNRGYSLDFYRNRVAKIRSRMPQAIIFTDLLVGFPGETEEQFQNTLRAIEEFNFHEVHMFAFSARPGTAAASLPNQLPEEIKQRRLRELIDANRRAIERR